MRKYIVMFAALACLAGTPVAYAAEVTPTPAPAPRPQPASTDWIAFAVSQNARVFKIDEGTEVSAKAEAMAECERKTIRSCNAISVKVETEVIAINCRSGGDRDSFIGGSETVDGALWVARNKARKAGYDPSGDCTQFFKY